MSSFARAPTWCFPPNSDVCAPFPSIPAPASPTRSIYPWGFYFEDFLAPSRNAISRHAGGVQFRVRSTTIRAQSSRGTHPKRPRRLRRLKGSHLAHTRWSRHFAASPIHHSATGAEEQELSPFFTGDPGGRQSRISQSRPVLSQRVLAIRGQTLRSRTL